MNNCAITTAGRKTSMVVATAVSAVLLWTINPLVGQVSIPKELFY